MGVRRVMRELAEIHNNTGQQSWEQGKRVELRSTDPSKLRAGSRGRLSPHTIEAGGRRDPSASLRAGSRRYRHVL